MHIWQRSSIPTCSEGHKRLRPVFALLAVLFGCSLFAALLFGSVPIEFGSALTALFRGDVRQADARILLYVRLPRVLGAVLAGSALAVSGAVIQGVLRNPMAGPNVIGVNAGAGLTASLLLAVFPAYIRWLPWAAFVGALGACLLIYGLARITGAGRVTITLAGVTISSILSAGINSIKILLPDSVYNTGEFLVGGLSGTGLEQLDPAWIMILAGLALALLLHRQLDVLGLGGDVAAGLGMKVERTRLICLVLAAVLAGAAVSFAGLLGFVGLLVPHAGRALVGNSHRLLLPFCILGGSVLVLLCDLAARVLFAPYQLPVGILLSLAGGPFFLYLLLQKRGAGL